MLSEPQKDGLVLVGIVLSALQTVFALLALFVSHQKSLGAEGWSRLSATAGMLGQVLLLFLIGELLMGVVVILMWMELADWPGALFAMITLLGSVIGLLLLKAFYRSGRSWVLMMAYLSVTSMLLVAAVTFRIPDSSIINRTDLRFFFSLQAGSLAIMMSFISLWCLLTAFFDVLGDIMD